MLSFIQADMLVKVNNYIFNRKEFFLRLPIFF